MKMRPGLAGFAILLLIGLSACSGAIIVDDSPGPRYSYFDGDFEYATRDGAILTRIAGNPFGIPQDRLESMVLDTMKGQNPRPPARFVADPKADGIDPLYKVVVAFNLPRRYAAEIMCAQGEKTPTQQGARDPVTMAIAFCIGDQPKSDAAGRAYGVSGPDDPRFADLVRQVTLAIVPPGDNEDQGEGDEGGVVP